MKRNRSIAVWLTPEEADALHAAARNAGMTRSAYARLILIGTPQPSGDTAMMQAKRRMDLDAALDRFVLPNAPTLRSTP